MNERTETHACDLISRQAAIDFIDAGHLCNPNEPRWSDNDVVNFLKHRPPAQSDLSAYSDMLWRAAYEKGWKEAKAEHMRTVFIESDHLFSTDKRRAILEDMKHEAGDDVRIVLLEVGRRVAEPEPYKGVENGKA